MIEREELAMRRVVSLLCAAFPHLPEPRIRTCVHEILADFATARIRDYLPILVERRARARLAHVSIAPDFPEPRRAAATGVHEPIMPAATG